MALPEPLPDFLTMPGSSMDLLRDEYINVITQAIVDHPRSQQKALGPSEIGAPCARKIGYKLLGFAENKQPPNWRATVGTAIHSWLEEQFGADDERHYQPEGTRWALEETLFCGFIDGLNRQIPVLGHCDLYDQQTFTVLDHKTSSMTQLKKKRSKGPGETYRIQAHIYGYGWRLAQRRVDNVAICFLPRDGDLSEAHFWSEPYDERIALDALKRVSGIQIAIDVRGADALSALPTADDYCRTCPFAMRGSTDLSLGCPGHAMPEAAIDPNAPAFGEV